MGNEIKNTSFSEVYDCFLGKITDDLWEISEYTESDTIQRAYLRNLLISIIPNFEFPRKNLAFYDSSLEENAQSIPDDNSIYSDPYTFVSKLTQEEINILALLMMTGWLQQQVTSIENTRMKYSGTDFKFTSQANHLAKLLTLLNECHRQCHHMQRLYKRRKVDSEGNISSNWSIFKQTNARKD